MAFVFHRRLALPLWAIVFFTVALTAPPPAMLFPMPPTTLFVIAALGIAGIIIMMPGLVPGLHCLAQSSASLRLDTKIRRVRQSK